MKIKPITVACAALLALSIQGCGSNKDIRGDQNLLSFLQEGKTTKQSVIATLGEPSMRLKNESILTYRIIRGKGDRLVTPKVSWKKVTHSVVLVFDNEDKLIEHKAVQVGGWGNK